MNAFRQLGDQLLSRLLGDQPAGACVPNVGCPCGCMPYNGKNWQKEYSCTGLCIRSDVFLCGQLHC